jgi:acyl dehydratase
MWRQKRRSGRLSGDERRAGSRRRMRSAMAATVFDGVDAVRAAVGRHLGYSDWLEITQDRVNLFADATGDHQWIHVDPVRAKDGPFGGPIAHGYLTVSLSNLFLPQIVEVQGISAGVNYGVNKIRFPSPVPVGARVRGGAELAAVEDVKGGIQTTMVITIEIEGQDRPACVIESLSRYLV